MDVLRLVALMVHLRTYIIVDRDYAVAAWYGFLPGRAFLSSNNL